MTSFVREDWVLFTNLNTLGQKAGVPVERIRQLVVKELTDNALDAGNDVTIEEWEGMYIVEDDGPGLPLRPMFEREDLARLFSVRRPLMSGKLRRPSRGALGNGLRVVTGAVLASDGFLWVETGGRCYSLVPQDDGTTIATVAGSSGVKGTRVSVKLGDTVPKRGNALVWANVAKAIGPQHYRGNTSCWWYDSASFFDLLRSGGQLPVKELLMHFDAGVRMLASLGATDDADPLEFGRCEEMTRETADVMLGMMREVSDKIKPSKLVSKQSAGHVRQTGELEVVPGRGQHHAFLPYVIDVFANESDYGDTITLMVNGTPVTGDVNVWRDGKNKLIVHGAGLYHHIEKVSRASASLTINITIPYMPITTDGKEPDCRRLFDPLADAIRKAMRRLKVEVQKKEKTSSQREVIERVLPDCVSEGSDYGRLPLSLRQLYYLVRPHLLDAGLPSDYNYFSRVITVYEAEHGEIQGLYRDPRGTLIHPHTREAIQLGTISVRDYRRPDWLVRNVLYCEKEGLFPLLLAAKWPERNDCALMSSKGFATRAARDVIDMLGDGPEDQLLRFFCIHDADASGTLIWQTLQEATHARPGRKVEIINLGLEPWEADRMGLQAESFEVKNNKPLAVAKYVEQHSDYWKRWLQRNRVELNAMKPDAFLAWLDDKFAPHRGEKLVPPAHVLRAEMRERMIERRKQELMARAMREFDFEGKLERAIEGIDDYVSSREVASELRHSPEKSWREVVAEKARE